MGQSDRPLVSFRNHKSKVCWGSDGIDPGAVHHKKTAKITQTDLDILVEATNGTCGIVLLMKEHNKNAEPDLTNVVDEEVVDNCFNTPRSVTDIMAGCYL